MYWTRLLACSSCSTKGVLTDSVSRVGPSAGTLSGQASNKLYLRELLGPPTNDVNVESGNKNYYVWDIWLVSVIIIIILACAISVHISTCCHWLPVWSVQCRLGGIFHTEIVLCWVVLHSDQSRDVRTEDVLSAFFPITNKNSGFSSSSTMWL